jgi:PAS domain S-box-containing protein
MSHLSADLPDTISKRRPFVILLIVVVVLAAATTLSLYIDRKVETLRQTRQQDVHLLAAKVQSALLELEVQTLRAQLGQGPNPTKLQEAFDTYSAFLTNLHNAPDYAQALQQPTLQRPAMALKAAHDEMAAAFTRQATPGLMAQIQAQKANATALRDAAKAWRLASEARADATLSRTLSRMGALSIGMVLVLSALTISLLLLSLQAQQRARQMRETANRLTTILETSLDAVVVFSATGRILAINSAAEQMFEFQRAEAIGGKMTDLLVPALHREKFLSTIRDYMLNGQSDIIGAGRISMTAMRKSRAIFPIEFSIDQIGGSDEPVFVTFIRDITERRATELTLVEARDKALAGERAKAEFLAVMSHEMRTPLNGLLGTLGLLQDTPLSDQQHAYISNMQASGKLLMHHVNDVLEISKLEAGKVAITNTPFSLHDMLEEIIQGQAPQAQANANTLNVHWVSQPVPYIVCDPVRLRQILLNLLSNALKFTKNGAVTLEIETFGKANSEEIEFRVIDTGIGIQEQYLEQIFGDFETVDGTYGRATQGTGLGLGISRRLTRAMGGEIGVESTVDVGSVFWVRLPLVRSAIPVEEQAATQMVENLPPLDVLIVEDNQINRVVLRDILRSEGHSVTEAQDGQQGVQQAHSHRFDVIMMDISMPVMDGLAATRAIRGGDGLSRATPIVAVTAHALAEEIKAFIAAGMNEVIGKPISRGELMQKLAKCCANAPETGQKPQPKAPPQPPQKGAQASGQNLLDEAQFQALLDDLGPEIAGKLLGRFAEEANATIAHVSTVSQAPQDTLDVPDLIGRLHKMAGSAGAMGALALHAKLAQLEQLGKTGALAQLQAELRGLPDIWHQTQAAISARL